MHYVRLSAATLIFLLFAFTGFAQSLQLADSLNRQGMDYYESGNYRQAEFYLGEAFKLYQQQADPMVWLSRGIEYAEILVDRSKYDQAITLFQRLKKVAVTLNNIQAQARIENDLGWAYKRTGKVEIALDHYERAIPLAKQAQDTLRLGYIYNNIGLIYRGWGNYKASLEYYNQSLSYKKKINRKESVAITLNNIGLSYKELSLYDKSLEYFEKSLVIKKDLGNIDLLATATSNIGLLYKQLGNFDQALVYYQQSLGYAQKAGNPVKTAQTLNNIGSLYSALGQPEQELAYYRQSLQLKEQYANAASLAVTYSNIAGSYHQNGQPKQALTYYQQALELRKKAGNPRTVASSLLELASVEQYQLHFLQSRHYIQQAKAIADSTQDLNLQQRAAFQLGNLNQSEGKLNEAVSHYHASLRYSQQPEGGVSLASIKRLAYTHNQLGSDSALYYGRRAIDIIEKTRSQTGSLSRLKAGYFKQHVNFYIAMASWKLKYRQDEPGAYHFVELAKARALSDELSQAAQRIDESLPEKERLERAQQLTDITDLYVQLEKNPGVTEKIGLKKRIRTKELAYASFEHQLVQEYPQYKRLENPEPISLERAKQMCDSKTAILEYAISDGMILAFLITRDQVQVEKLAIDTEESPGLANQVSKFREGIMARIPKDSLQALSRPIYNQLIAPFNDQLSRYNNLIVIPDRFLAYLPFEALQNNTNYLVSQFNIKYAPSVTGYSLIKQPHRAPAENIIAIGNSTNYDSMSGLPALPSLGLEIKSVSSLFKNATILEDKDVSEENVKTKIQENFSVAHIAAHSVIDENNSSLSGIILGNTGSSEGMGNDGYLRNNEIYRLNIPSNMVVLSACKSGIGNVINGEGMLGLQRAFFNAGASTVVVSLWDVYDRSTTHFMKSFYTSLMDKNRNPGWSDSWQSLLRWVGWDASVPYGNASASLRETKLAMLKHPRYHHPVYWAPFIVVGR